jgi:anaerobic magnesium-protoporphyrin IX monomethyl ester cyclase
LKIGFIIPGGGVCCKQEPDACSGPWEEPPLNVLLFSMPDAFEHTAPLAIRIPNAALTSLAGNVDAHHRVAVADLVLARGRVGETVDRLVREHRPDLVGLSVMTFQRRTAFRLIERLRRSRPDARVVVGGYDPSLATDAWTGEPPGVDFIARGEGEETLSELLRALETGGPLESIKGLSFRAAGGFCHNPPRPVRPLEDDTLRLPRRDARVLDGYTLLGKPIDVVETSRGCTFDCSFCSIVTMRGRNFHRRGFERVIADIRDARAHGARALFIVDDNITLDVRRFEALCDAIVAAGLDDVEYVVQAMTSAIADHGATLAPKMRRAGFRYVFLGIENVLAEDLGFLKAEAKNRRHENGRSAGSATLAAIDHVHRNGMWVVGGLIVGNPGDTRESIEANLEFARRHVDWPYIQHPTPYPGTPMTKDLLERGLILHERLEEYDGTTAVVRGEALAAEEIEFLRWRAERWMKLRFFPAALVRHPLFCLRHGAGMIRHTLRGSWRSLVGLESERRAFERFCAIRGAERELA